MLQAFAAPVAQLPIYVRRWSTPAGGASCLAARTSPRSTTRAPSRTPRAIRRGVQQLAWRGRMALACAAARRPALGRTR
eukprot:7023856-Alexandrium_andersonii.AAC.1